MEFLKYKDYPEDVETEILKTLEKGHPVALDKLYAYQFSSGVIERILRQDYEIGGRDAFHIPREKPLSMDPQQTKLGVESHKK